MSNLQLSCPSCKGKKNWNFFTGVTFLGREFFFFSGFKIFLRIGNLFWTFVWNFQQVLQIFNIFNREFGFQNFFRIFFVLEFVVLEFFVQDVLLRSFLEFFIFLDIFVTWAFLSSLMSSTCLGWVPLLYMVWRGTESRGKEEGRGEREEGIGRKTNML
jgi:hypothetical protein